MGKAGNPNIREVSKATQFKPGVSGNPTGNHKGTKHLTTWIQELLEDENFEANLLDPKIGITPYKGAPIKAITQVILVKAINGDLKAADILMKYGWSQKIDNNYTGEIHHVYEELDDDQLAAIIEARKDRLLEGS